MNEEIRRGQFTRELKCLEQDSKNKKYAYYFCAHYNVEIALHRSIICVDFEDELREEILNLITEYMIRLNSNNETHRSKRVYFYFDDKELENTATNREFQYVNVAKLMRNYPRKAIDVANRSLINLSIKYPQYGDFISPWWKDKRIYFEHKINNNHTSGVFGLLEDLGYVRDPEQKGYYIITAAGWQKIEELLKENQVVRQGFVAMSFCEETEPIREAFRQAMEEVGYNVRIIDEKEHNNQIVPEIFFEIQRSKFVVVDVTYPNYGAYYEAGYAQALGKQVIICCREDKFNGGYERPHFDISQKAMIIWKDEKELVERLKRRIEATVGGL